MQRFQGIFTFITTQKYIRLNTGACGSQAQGFHANKSYSFENITIKRTKLKKKSDSPLSYIKKRASMVLDSKSGLLWTYIYIYMR